MKKIKDLNTIITDFENNAITGPDGPVRFRKMLLNFIGASKATNGEEAIQSVGIGIKIAAAGDEVSLEDAEINLLEKKVGENSIQASAMVQGKVLQIIKAALKIEA